MWLWFVYFHTFRNKLPFPLIVVTIFFYICIIKQLFDLVFVISRIIKFSIRVMSFIRRLRPWLFRISIKPHPIIVYYQQWQQSGSGHYYDRKQWPEAMTGRNDRKKWPEPDCWLAVFVKTMVRGGCSLRKTGSAHCYFRIPYGSFFIVLTHKQAAVNERLDCRLNRNNGH